VRIHLFDLQHFYHIDADPGTALGFADGFGEIFRSVLVYVLVEFRALVGVHMSGLGGMFLYGCNVNVRAQFI